MYRNVLSVVLSMFIFIGIDFGSAQVINDNFDIFKSSPYTTSELKKSVSGKSHRAMLPYIKTIKKAESKYGVNSLYLMSKLGYESGWGRYMSGRNNIAGWTDGNGSYANFSSVDNCIMHVAKHLSTDYKKKVGSKLVDINKRYCPDKGYNSMLIRIMKERRNRIESFA